MFGARSSLFHYSKRLINLRFPRNLCNNSTPSNNKLTPQNPQNNAIDGTKLYDKRDDVYRDLDNLDFMKAAKILFSDQPNKKKKKFGLDFHLVQLFFALMPSFAVYLVAQYSRHEMRKMEAALELKKKAEEEAKAKLMEAAVVDEKESESDLDLLKVKERLEALEEVVKEIAVETKKRSSDNKSKSADETQDRVDSKHVSNKNQLSNQASVQPLKQEDNEKKGSHEDEKK